MALSAGRVASGWHCRQGMEQGVCVRGQGFQEGPCLGMENCVGMEVLG